MSATASVIRPSSVEALSDAVRDATASSTPEAFCIVGGGSWLPPRVPTTRLEMAGFSGVRAYAPDDLTMTVGAATTLAELDATTRAHNQWCPLLAWGDDRATVGAVVATATAGPFASTLGRPRDLVLGLEAVDGRGRIVRAGGRVVKNVAGFDITRLMTGAWGTLGAITEVHLRLRARPHVDETVALSSDPNSDDAIREFARGPLAPLGALRLDERAASALDLPNGTRWLVRFGGNAPFVAAARLQLGIFGAMADVAGTTWDDARRLCAPESPLARWQDGPLARRVRDAFDPHRVMNRGVLPSVDR